MEEILASIRRIIADDEAKPPVAEKPASPAAAAKPAAPAAKPTAMADILPSAILPDSFLRTITAGKAYINFI